MFVILGSLRSGTTLLAQCLNAHPELVVPDETDFIIPAAFVINRVADESLGKRLVGDLVVGSRRYADSIGRYLDPDAVRSAVADAPYDVAGVVSGIYEAVAGAAGVQVAGDKSPNDIQYLRVLLDDGFFDAGVKVLHIVRDVRDVMASMVRLGWLPRLRDGYPRFWSSDNVFAANRLGQVPERYHRVRYEDLARDPVGVLAGACDFLGVTFTPSMVDGEQRRQASHHPNLPHHERTFGAISTEGIGAYRGAFDDAVLTHVERLGGEGLRAFGYLT